MQRYLTWRIGRRDYCVGSAIYFIGFYLVAAFVSQPLATTALPFVWMLALAVPRLRDIGWSTWWAVAPFGAGSIVGLGGSLLPKVSAGNVVVPPTIFAIIGVGSLAFMLALAFKRSRVDAEEVFG